MVCFFQRDHDGLGRLRHGFYKLALVFYLLWGAGECWSPAGSFEVFFERPGRRRCASVRMNSVEESNGRQLVMNETGVYSDPFTTIDRPKQQEQTRRLLAFGGQSKRRKRRSRVARFITGLVMATSDECENLEILVDIDKNSPMRDKQINSIRISFSRLGFKPLRLGGLSEKDAFTLESLVLSSPYKPVMSTVDEAFQAIDVDSSGKLDRSELARALANAMALGDEDDGSMKSWKNANPETVVKLAGSLLRLYDTNGDGELDRNE